MTRYTLKEQLHFLADVPGRGNVVVTLQHWQAPGPKAVHVVTYDGVQVTRKFTDNEADVESLTAYIEAKRQAHAADVLSDVAAHDEVARRGGPAPQECLKGDCPAMIPIPFASEQCAAGCDATGRGRIEFVSAGLRRPPLTVVTGGKP